MNELALAAFAAASDAHLIGEPRSARFAAFKARFDAAAELARLAARIPLPRPLGSRLPAPPPCDPRPAAGALCPGRG